MTIREIGVCLHHRQALDQLGHVHRLVRCNTFQWVGFQFYQSRLLSREEFLYDQTKICEVETNVAEARNNQQSRCDTGVGRSTEISTQRKNTNPRSTALQLAETRTHRRVL